MKKAPVPPLIVTIDAMGCQYKIAGQIVSQKAGYVFAIKENQESLYQDVTEYFQKTMNKWLLFL